MTQFIEQLSNMVAQARPQRGGGGGPAGSVSMPTPQAPQQHPLTPAAHGFGKGFGDSIAEQMDFLYNPERVKERAKQTWEMIVDMPDELRSQVLSQPEVQKKLEEYHKHMPAMFFKDKNMGGMFNAVDSKTMQQQERIARTQEKLVEAQTKRQEGVEKREQEVHEGTFDLDKQRKVLELADLMATTEGRKLSNEEATRMQDLNVEELSARISQIRAQTGHYTASTQALLQKLPVELQQMVKDLKLTDEQIANLAASTARTKELTPWEKRGAIAGVHKTEADIQRTEQQMDLDEREARRLEMLAEHKIMKYRQEWIDVQREEHNKKTEHAYKDMLKKFAELEKMYTAMYSQPPEYWQKRAQAVSNMVSAQGFRMVEMGEEKLRVPTAIEDPRAQRYIHGAIDETYQAYGKAFDSGRVEDVIGLLETATRLWDSTYGMVPPEVQTSFIPAEELMRMEAQMAVMLLALDQVSHKPIHKMTDASKQSAQQFLTEYGIPGGYIDERSLLGRGGRRR